MKTVLVTGANRGIGLELCKQLHAANYKVIAVCRKSSSKLKEHATTIIQGIDVSEITSIEKLRQQLSQPLDVVINCAGVLEGTSLTHLDFSSLEKQFQVNTLGPLRIVKAVESFLKKGSKILMITSRMGSIADNESGGSYGYRISKTALNSASKSLSLDLKESGVAVGIIHPGWVQTEMTGYSGHIKPAESAAGILKRLDELTLENTGTFWHQNGEILPW